MARTGKVKPGQVWSDARGRHLQVTQNPGPDGKFQCKNLETGRTMFRGPRALVNMVQDAPYGDAGQIYPSSHRATSVPPYQAPDEDDPGMPAYPPAAAWGGQGWAPSPPPPAPRRAPPTFSRNRPPKRVPPPRRAPAQAAPAPVVYPNGNGHGHNPLSYPSPLTQFVAEKLAAMRPEHAHSPAFVSRVMGAALAEWKSIQRPGAY